MTRDFRDERIEELERDNAQLRARVDELQALLDAQRQRIASQERQIQELEA